MLLLLFLVPPGCKDAKG